MVTASRQAAVGRRARASAHAHPQPVRVRPLAGGLVVRAAEENFLAAVLDDLRQADWKDRLDMPVRRLVTGERGALELPPPTHGVFSLALAEVHCASFGMPRLDPAAIEGAGLVIRRIRPDGKEEGWMSQGARRKGWLPVADPLADPDPARRLGIRTGNPVVDGARARTRLAGALVEQEHPMFVAPPDVAATTGRTVILGVVPTASREASEDQGGPAAFDGMEADLAQHFGMYFEASLDARSLPFAGVPIGPDMVTGENGRPRDAFFVFVRMLAAECDAFGGSSEAAALRALLGRIVLAVPDDASGATLTMGADDFLREVSERVFGDRGAGALRMPARWPPLSAADALALRAAATRCVAARFSALAPQQGRFEDPAWLYTVRVFVRVRRHRECPGRIEWCAPVGAPFRILPWWAGGGKSVAIPLPDVLDPAVRKMLRSGVSFAVPPALANFINQDHTETLGGTKPPKGSGPGIAWICSLSIPIITVCAFIALCIIVALLNFVFRWMPLFRICLPIPKQERRP